LSGGGIQHRHEDELAELANDDAHTLHREQALGGVSARAKVLALGMVLAANLASSSPAWPAAIFVVSAVLLLRSGVPRGTLLKRLMVPWYFAAVVLVTQLLFSGQTELFGIGPFVARAEGLARGVLIASKVIGGTAAVLLVSMTTPVTGLLATAAWLRVPRILLEIAVLTYRYLFLLAEEADRIREAQKTRMGYSSWWGTIRSLSTLGGMVVVNSFDRSERVYQSMLMRGYKGQLPMPDGEAKLSRADLLALAATASVLAAILGTDVL
jgi:cobalt/nickel transport system permease protein